MQNLKTLLLISFFIFHFSFFIFDAHASNYVLPYPSYMPGHKLYCLHQVWEKIQEYWYFGNLAKFKYHLKVADKYLVEAKTLFEYDQYFLATIALRKSSHHFQQISLFLEKAKQEGKDINQKQAVLKSASEKHQEILKKLLNQLPEEFFWQEEKKEGERLEIRKMIEEVKEKIDLVTEVIK